MDDDELRQWIQAWADNYRAGDDVVLQPLAGLPQLTREQLGVVIEWKLEPRWQPGTFKRLALESDEHIADLTRRAFACNDELGALLILCDLNGVGPPVASSILLAYDPIRYTVMDVNANKSLHALGELPEGSAERAREWPAYLAACRRISERTDLTLRVVDQGLYMARGNLSHPSS